jgi:hypothetical protein
MNGKIFLTSGTVHLVKVVSIPASYLGGPTFDSWNWRLAILTLFCDFPQSHQTNAGIVPETGYDLLHSSQCIINIKLTWT